MLGGLNNLYRMSLLITADIRGFTTGLERAERKLLRFSGTVNKFGQSLNRGVGLAFGIVGAAAVSAAAEFDRANATLGQIVGKTNLQPLTDEAKRLGRETVFLAKDAAAAQLELAKLGFRADEVNSVLDKSTKLATVFGTDLEATGKTIAATLRQFGKSLRGEEGIENVAEVTDIMAVAFRDSALDLTKFKESMKNVGPTARATGLDLTQTTALLAVLANNAVDGSLGGTKLRSTLSDLARKFPDVEEGLKKLNDQTLTYADLVELLNKRAALVGAIFQDNGEEIKAFEQTLLNAKGATDEMASGLEKKLFFQVEKLKNAFQSIGIELGDALAPTIESMAGTLSRFAVSLEQVDERKLSNIVSILTGIVGLGVGAQVLGFFGITMGRVAAASRAMSVALIKNTSATASFARGLGPAIAAATALAGVMGGIFKLLLGGDIGGFKLLDVETSEEKALKVAEQRLERIASIQKRLNDERERPSFRREDLEAFTGNTTLEGINKDLGFYRDLLARAQEKMTALVDAGAQRDSYFLKIEKVISDTELEIAANERLAKILARVAEASEKIKLAKQAEEDAKALAKAQKETRALQQVTDDLRASQLALVRGTDIPAVFGQGFMFDQLDAAKQLVALLNGKAIVSAQEFANTIDLIELDEEDINFEMFQDPIDDATKQIDKLAEKLILIREGLVVARVVALEFAQSLGQAFIESRQEGVKFFDAFKESFLRAFRAVIGKLITLIALYTILAVVSGGTSVAAGGTFAGGFQAFTGANPLGAFLGEGFGVGTRASASGIPLSGGRDSMAQVNVRGAVSGTNLIILNERGARAVDRTFG